MQSHGGRTRRHGGAQGNGGEGGIANSGGTLTVVDSTISANTAGIGGVGGNGNQGTAASGAGGTGGPGFPGGGLSSVGGTVSVTNSTFASNVAGAGRLPAARWRGRGNATAVNGGSGGDGGGGGAMAATASASGLLLNVTIAANERRRARRGRNGRHSVGSPGTAGPAACSPRAPATTLEDSLLLERRRKLLHAGSPTAVHNLSFAAGGMPARRSRTRPQTRLTAGQRWPTKTISLQPGSAAIDRIAATGAGCPATDQRGVPRPSGAACDIGAYEVAATGRPDDRGHQVYQHARP